MIGLFQIPPEGVPYISRFDDALNLEAADLVQWFRTLDRKHLPCHPDKTPTVFFLRRLSLRQFEALRAAPAAQQDRLAVAYALERVDNFRMANGDTLRCVHVGEGDDLRLDMPTLAAMHAPTLFVELGQVIFTISGLDPLSGGR